MTIERINPDGLLASPAYTHVTVSHGTQIIHLAGQVAQDATGAIIGSTHEEQAEQVWRNLLTALAAVDATIEDVAKRTIYIVDYTPDVLPGLGRATTKVLGPDAPTPASTLIGVASLYLPGLLIEIDAVVVR